MLILISGYTIATKQIFFLSWPSLSKRCTLLFISSIPAADTVHIFVQAGHENKSIDGTQLPAKWQRQAYSASRWTATWTFDLWTKLFRGAGQVRVLNSAALCMAITWERNLAFQLQPGHIAVCGVSDDYSSGTLFLAWSIASDQATSEDVPFYVIHTLTFVPRAVRL